MAATDSAADSSADERPARRWPLLVLAAGVVAGGVIGMVLLWPGPVDVVESPGEPPATSSQIPAASTPLPPPAPTSAPVMAPPVIAPPVTVAPEVTVLPDPLPSLATSPPSVVPPSATRQPPTSTIRPPISVSPVPRPAFPNQPSGDGADDEGGLLGGGGLL